MRKEITMRAYDETNTRLIQRATLDACRLMAKYDLQELSLKRVARAQVEVRAREHGGQIRVVAMLSAPPPDLSDCA
jgi:hypothetical protein